MVDEVLPRVPWRQWTLAFPRGLKLALAIDAKLLSAALRAFIGAIFAFQRRRAKQLGIDAQTRLPLGEEPPRRARRCAFLEGFSLHANTQVHENDRESLERLVRYGARGPLALERLSRREDGKLEYRLRKPLPGGATILVLTPVQLLERLCSVMVKPRVHLTRFFGVFAPNSKARAQVVPQRPAEQPAPVAT